MCMQLIGEQRPVRHSVKWIRTITKTAVALAVLLASVSSAESGLPGIVLDPTFDAEEGLPARWVSPSDVQGVLTLPDGTILIWGGFTNLQGSLRTGVALLDPNGRLVEAFNPRIAFVPGQHPSLSSVARQPDGKLLISGLIESVNDVSVGRFVRLNIDGSLDHSFDADRNLDRWAQSLAVLSNGKILVTTTLEGSESNGPLAQLNTIDLLGEEYVRLDISSGANLVGTPGSLLVVGPSLGSDEGFVTRIVALDENGVPQNEISTPHLPAPISIVHRQPDGKYLIVTEKTDAHRFHYSVNTFLTRLNPDGTVDSEFHPQAIGQHVQSGFGYYAVAEVEAVSLQPDGKIWIAGWFVSYNGTSRTNLARLNADGALDLSFDPGEGPDGRVAKVYPQPNNRAILLGDFAAISGFPRPNVARVFTDGTTIGAIRFREATMTVGEVQGSADISVLRYGDARDSMEVSYVAHIRRPGVENPQTLLGGSLQFGAAETEKIIAVPLGENSIAEDDRTIEISLAVRSDLPRPSPLIITVMDDEKPGSLDFSFSVDSTSAAYSDWTRGTTIQTDGLVLMAGTFKSKDGQEVTGIVRFRDNGELDSDFRPTLETDAFVNEIAIQPDGMIIVAYSTNSGTTLVRLYRGGARDYNFIPTTRISGVMAIVVQSDGRILVGGYDNYGVQTARLVSLNPDGSTDSSFNPALSGYIVSKLELQADGKILVAGSVRQVGSIEADNVLRLHPDGSRDRTFALSSPLSGYITGMVLQPDGRILVSGNDLQPGGRCLVRLLADGSVDNTFNVPFESFSFTQSMLLENTGRILISGSFKLIGGEETGRLLRLNSNGSLDQTYGGFPFEPFRSPPTLLGLQQDGKALVDIFFGYNQPWPPSRIVRLNADPPLSLDSVKFKTVPERMPELTLRTLPSRSYLLQVSSDLFSWSDLRIVTTTNYAVSVEDNEAGGSTHRFYRAVEVSPQLATP